MIQPKVACTFSYKFDFKINREKKSQKKSKEKQNNTINFHWNLKFHLSYVCMGLLANDHFYYVFFLFIFQFPSFNAQNYFLSVYCVCALHGCHCLRVPIYAIVHKEENETVNIFQHSNCAKAYIPSQFLCIWCRICGWSVIFKMKWNGLNTFYKVIFIFTYLQTIVTQFIYLFFKLMMMKSCAVSYGIKWSQWNKLIDKLNGQWCHAIAFDHFEQWQ